MVDKFNPSASARSPGNDATGSRVVSFYVKRQHAGLFRRGKNGFQLKSFDCVFI